MVYRALLPLMRTPRLPVASTLHTNSEHGVSSITTNNKSRCAHLGCRSRLNWRPRRFKWTRPFRRKTRSGFCVCAITFQMASISMASVTADGLETERAHGSCAVSPPPLPGLPLHNRPNSMQSDQCYTNMNWINLALEWARLLYLSNVRLNIRVPHQRVGNGRISWQAVRLSASQERLCFSELVVDCLLVARMRARRP